MPHCTSWNLKICSESCLAPSVAMFSSARNLPSKHWKRTLSPQSQHRLLHGSYPPTEPLRIAHSPDQRSWNSGSTLQPMVPWSSTMSVPSSQDLSYFDHIFPSLTGGHEYGSSQNPSEVLTTEHFSAPCQGLGLSNGMEALYTSPDPWNSLTLGSSCCANTSFHEPLTSNCGSSNCETPSMDDDIPLDFDFDFGSDLRIAPVGSTASEWNTLFSSTGLPYQGSRPGFHTGNDIQGFDLDRFEAQTFRNDFDVTASFDGISRNTQDETAVDESSMPQDLQDILLTSGRLEQPRISPSMDVESFKCEAPGCGKIFNKRHRYK